MLTIVLLIFVRLAGGASAFALGSKRRRKGVLVSAGASTTAAGLSGRDLAC